MNNQYTHLLVTVDLFINGHNFNEIVHYTIYVLQSVQVIDIWASQLWTNICMITLRLYINDTLLSSILSSSRNSFFFSGSRGEHVHLLCAVEDLMPSIGTIVPPPAVLATTIWQSEAVFRNIEKQSRDLGQIQSTHSVISDTNTNQNMYQGTMTYLTSISEDGKIWSWHLSFDKSACARKDKLGANQWSVQWNSYFWLSTV